MTKKELIKALHAKHPEFAINYLEQIVDIFFNELTQALEENKRIEIRGFGTFTPKKRKARIARNPSNNKIINVKDKVAIGFKPGKVLNKFINEHA
jgi:integration host factor subunit beta